MRTPPSPLPPAYLAEIERIYDALDKDIRSLQSLHFKLRQHIRRSKASVRDLQTLQKEANHERLITNDVTPSASRGDAK